MPSSRHSSDNRRIVVREDAEHEVAAAPRVVVSTCAPSGERPLYTVKIHFRRVGRAGQNVTTDLRERRIQRRVHG